MSKHIHSILCLGDSYTIGEGVALHESFPYQTVQILRSKGLHFHAPEIVAKTGWTTFELAEHMLHTKLNEYYDFVTLLIGVNNHYRDLNADDFKTDFDFLLKKAIHLAANNAAKVIVLSIPDWSITPFAKGMDAKEINAHNKICESISLQYKTHFINITDGTRNAVTDISLLTKDELHYSAKEMSKWANAVAGIIVKQL